MTEPSIRSFTASDGYRICFRHWPSKTPRGIVIAMHGIQSHSGWFEDSSRTIAEAGFDVYFADRRGSGGNDLQRGHAAHGMRLINDTRALAAIARDEHRNSGGDESRLPIVLMGISWGGKTAAATVALFPHEFDGLALLYPGLEPKLRPNAWQRWRLQMARRLEITKTDIPIPLRAAELFTDTPRWRQFIEDDPLALHSVTSSFLNAGRDLDAIVAANKEVIQCPVLLMLAGRDRIVDNEKNRALVASFGSRHLTAVCYPDACHTLEFESDRTQFFLDLTGWLKMIQQVPCQRQVQG